MTNLSDKETMLIKDQKANEELCIAKYEKAIREAQDPELKQIFSSNLAHERQHLTSINSILNGNVPNLQSQQNSGQGSTQSSTQESSNSNQGTAQSSNSVFNNSQFNMYQNQMNSNFGMETASEISPNKKHNEDCLLCLDLLSIEKYASSAYDTAIFECLDPKIRKVLNHIQKEEQEHGEKVSSYMISHGYLQVK